ncbi:MAG: hypothetical protein ACTS6J_05145 [Burkholderiales bacterium]
MTTLSREDMDLVFRDARTHNGWQAKPVSDASKVMPRSPRPAFDEVYKLA